MASYLPVAAILAACSNLDPVAAPAPAVAEWERNDAEHWYLDKTGEQAGVEANSMTDVVCDICGCEIWVYDDGTKTVCEYDQDGELVSQTRYDAQGNVIEEDL